MLQADYPTRKTLHKIVFEINKIRVSKKLSAARLAAKASMCESTIGAVESQKRDCYTLTNVLKICEALDIKPSELFQRIGE